MRRVVSLFLPHWSIDRLRRKRTTSPPDATAPAATAIAEHGRRVIAATDAQARALGIKPGMTVTQARSFAGQLEVFDADPQADLDGLAKIALWAGQRYAPIVAPDPPDGIWLDITGCAQLFDTERALLKDLHRRISGFGLTVQIAVGDADGFGSLALSRRAGLWAVKGLGQEALPLFAVADARAGKLLAEAYEPAVELAAMTEGAQVVEDYRASGLSLRAHPVAFLRDELRVRKMISCEALRSIRDGRWVELAGIVLVRQKPGSAKGVMFITLEDETEVANLVVWTKVFEANRRTVLGASMLGVRGQVQREGEVIHVIAQRLDDLSPLLASVGCRADVADIYRTARGDVARSPVAPDPRDPGNRPLGRAARAIYIPDLRLGSGIVPGQPTEGIKIKPRDFR
jgi:hypothetical protein